MTAPPPRSGPSRRRLRTLGRASALALAAALAAPAPSRGIDFEKLVMPGKVIRGHAEIEADCGKCHQPFETHAQESLCLDCHDAVAADIAAREGFHGRAAGVSGAACRSCHSEHRGRDADVVGLDPETFDHDATDQPLGGAHQRLACDACHSPGARFREAPSACVECHREDDAHAGRLGPECADCHGERAWSEARFDHAETRFPLEGEHREVACSLCHPGERYEKTPADCQGCHRLEDAHLGRFGPDCETCHTPRSWATLRFDHDRDTKFPLLGRHREASCESCHSQGLPGRKLPSDCRSCHEADDVHRGRNGPKCETCHSAESWKTEKFDHDRMTEFPLRGLHRNVKCEGCHRANPYEEKLARDCLSCHRDDDVHRSQLGQECERCHSEAGWERDLFFDHDLGRFPLLGLHAVAACDQCHLTPRFKDAEVACVSCHELDDIHLGRLGPSCALCHNPNGWKVWRFDHDAQTRFALGGAHQGLDCHACHRVPVTTSAAIGGGCQACHAEDDVHRGAYGRDCARCHGDSSWREIEMMQ